MTIFAIRFRKGQVHLQLGVRETEEVKKGGAAAKTNCDLAWDLQVTAYAQRAGPPAVDVQEPIGTSGLTPV